METLPIVDLRPLGRIRHIYGGLVIQGTALTSLAGLENLSSVGEHLFIEHNGALTSLSGLENLSSVGGHLRIEGNSALTSCSSHLSGLISGDEFPRGASEPASAPIAGGHQFAGVDGTVDIGSNASGCNSPQQVLRSHGAIGVAQ